MAAAGDGEEYAEFVERTGTGGFPHVVDDDGDLWTRFGAEIRSSFLFVDDETGPTQRTGYGEMSESLLRDLASASWPDRPSFSSVRPAALSVGVALENGVRTPTLCASAPLRLLVSPLRASGLAAGGNHLRTEVRAGRAHGGGTARHNRNDAPPAPRRAERPRDGEQNGQERAMATKSIVGEKVGMTQVWTDDGRVVPVTVVRVQTARVVQVKTPETDGYSAVQVTYGTRDARKLTKPKAGHFAKAGVDAGTRLVELRLDDVSSFEVGAKIGADTFDAGDRVDVTAVSKGKGFAGVMKRHGFSGMGASHGSHRVHGPRLHRRLRHAVPRAPRHEDGRPHGRRAGHHPEPRGRQGRPRGRCRARQGLGPRTQRRRRTDPQRHQAS